MLSQLLGIDMGEMEKATRKQFGKKVKAADLNMGALKAGAEYAQQNLPKQDPFSVERMHKTDGQILIEGNTAGALGAMFAGVTVVAWYPITPSSSLPEALIGYMKKHRIDKATGKATYAIVQAEDEIASIGMVLGAGWAGRARDDVDLGPGHLADERVRRPGLLRGSAGRRVRHPARRARPPACRRARRRGTSPRRRCCRTATPSRSCSSRARSKSATRWRWTRSTSPSASSSSSS